MKNNFNFAIFGFIFGIFFFNHEAIKGGIKYTTMSKGHGGKRFRALVSTIQNAECRIQRLENFCKVLDQSEDLGDKKYFMDDVEMTGSNRILNAKKHLHCLEEKGSKSYSLLKNKIQLGGFDTMQLLFSKKELSDKEILLLFKMHLNIPLNKNITKRQIFEIFVGIFASVVYGIKQSESSFYLEVQNELVEVLFNNVVESLSDNSNVVESLSDNSVHKSKISETLTVILKASEKFPKFANLKIQIEEFSNKYFKIINFLAEEYKKLEQGEEEIRVEKAKEEEERIRVEKAKEEEERIRVEKTEERKKLRALLFKMAADLIFDIKSSEKLANLDEKILLQGCLTSNVQSWRTVRERIDNTIECLNNFFRMYKFSEKTENDFIKFKSLYDQYKECDESLN